MCKILSIDVDDELQGERWGGGEVEKRSREKEWNVMGEAYKYKNKLEDN